MPSERGHYVESTIYVEGKIAIKDDFLHHYMGLAYYIERNGLGLSSCEEQGLIQRLWKPGIPPLPSNLEGTHLPPPQSYPPLITKIDAILTENQKSN